MGLLVIVVGAIILVTTLLAAAHPAVRHLESDLPDSIMAIEASSAD
jgi:hypothetical protein